MRVLKLIPIFVLFLLLSGGQVMFLSSQAYAACCACGTCKPRCSCCSCKVQACLEQLLGGDKFTLETEHSGPVQIVADPDVLAELKILRRGDCGNFKLRFFGNVEDGLQFRCTGFEKQDPKDPKVDPKVKMMTKEFEDAVSIAESEIPESDPARGGPGRK